MKDVFHFRINSDVGRPDTVVLEYTDLKGDKKRIDASGLWQHVSNMSLTISKECYSLIDYPR